MAKNSMQKLVSKHLNNQDALLKKYKLLLLNAHNNPLEGGRKDSLMLANQLKSALEENGILVK